MKICKCKAGIIAKGEVSQLVFHNLAIPVDVHTPYVENYHAFLWKTSLDLCTQGVWNSDGLT